MPPDVAEVWENQRFYGIAWSTPGLLERPAWSDEDGNPVAIQRPPSEARHLGWHLLVSTATAADGWQYASVFKHFEYQRPGGRSSQRATDLVRRRCWRRESAPSGLLTAAAAVAAGQPGTGAYPRPAKLGQQPSEQAAAGDVQQQNGEPAVRVLVSPATEMDGHRPRKETEMEKRKAVVKLFIGMVSASIKRWQVWNLMPLDPMAWLVMYNEHQTALSDLIASNMQHRLPLEAVRDVAPQQAEEGSSMRDAGLVRDLLTAAMHSRAAYGYAMQAGHLQSVLNFALMHTVHSLSFDAAGGASGEANNQAVATLAGVRAEDIMMFEWNNSIGRPCHYVAVDRANHCVVLSIRGSLEAGDIFSDISANPLEMQFGQTSGHVHEGIMAAATYVHSNAAGALAAAGRDFPGWPLFITGHSMGGAVASLVTMLLQDHGLPEGLASVRCVAIGPAAVMSADLADAAKPYVTSLCLRSDFVPRLTYAGVEGLFLELVDCSPVRRAAKGVGQKISGALESLKVGWGSKPLPQVAPGRTQPTGLEGVAALAKESQGVAVSAATDAAQSVRNTVGRLAASAGAPSTLSAHECVPGSAANPADGSMPTRPSADPADCSTSGVVPAAAAAAGSSSPVKARRTGSAEQAASPRRASHGMHSRQRSRDDAAQQPLPAVEHAADYAIRSPTANGHAIGVAASEAPAHSGAGPRQQQQQQTLQSQQRQQQQQQSVQSQQQQQQQQQQQPLQSQQQQQCQQPAQLAKDGPAGSRNSQAKLPPGRGGGPAEQPAHERLPDAAHAPDDIEGATRGGGARAQRASHEEAAMAAEVLSGGKGDSHPKRPEMLYPAGRVLWIIPSDEPAVEDGDAAADAIADEVGLFQSGGQLPREPCSSSPRDPKNSSKGARNSPRDSPVSSPRSPARHTSQGRTNVATGFSLWRMLSGGGGSSNGSRKGSPTGSGAGSPPVASPKTAAAPGIAPSVTGIVVPTSEYAAKVPAGRITGFGGGGGGGFGPETHDEEAVQQGAQKQGKAKHAAPAVLDVDRRVFARILLSPDTMSDHLPDSYLSAIQQL